RDVDHAGSRSWPRRVRHRGAPRRRPGLRPWARGSRVAFHVRPHTGLCPYESVRTKSPVHLLPCGRGYSELVLELENRRNTCSRFVCAIRDTCTDNFSDLLPPRAVVFELIRHIENGRHGNVASQDAPCLAW